MTASPAQGKRVYHSKHTSTGWRSDIVSPWTRCHPCGSHPRNTAARKRRLWVAPTSTQRHKRDTNMVVERGSAAHEQHAQPQHVLSTTSYKTDVQEWHSLAVAPDSKTRVTLSLYVQQAQGFVEPGKAHAVGVSTRHEESLKTFKAKMLPGITRRHRRRNPRSGSEGGGTNETSGTSETSVSGMSADGDLLPLRHQHSSPRSGTRMKSPCLDTPPRSLILTQLHTHPQCDRHDR